MFISAWFCKNNRAMTLQWFAWENYSHHVFTVGNGERPNSYVCKGCARIVSVMAARWKHISYSLRAHSDRGYMRPGIVWFSFDFPLTKINKDFSKTVNTSNLTTRLIDRWHYQNLLTRLHGEMWRQVSLSCPSCYGNYRCFLPALLMSVKECRTASCIARLVMYIVARCNCRFVFLHSWLRLVSGFLNSLFTLKTKVGAHECYSQSRYRSVQSIFAKNASSAECT